MRPNHIRIGINAVQRLYHFHRLILIISLIEIVFCRIVPADIENYYVGNPALIIPFRGSLCRFYTVARGYARIVEHVRNGLRTVFFPAHAPAAGCHELHVGVERPRREIVEGVQTAAVFSGTRGVSVPFGITECAVSRTARRTDEHKSICAAVVLNITVKELAVRFKRDYRRNSVVRLAHFQAS